MMTLNYFRNKKYEYTVLLISATILFSSAFYIFPVAGSDSIFFLPAAWFFANHMGLINPLVPLACETDPLHLCRFCFHLPLFPWLVGSVAKIHPTIRTIFVITGLISLIKIILFDQLLISYIENKKQYYFIYICSILVLTFYSLPSSGRPEILSSLIILCTYAFYKSISTRYTIFFIVNMAIILGILLSCHIAAYYFSILIFTITCVLDYQTIQKKILCIISVLVISIFIGLLVFWVSPNSIDNIKGIIAHSQMQINRHGELSLKNFFYYLFFNPSLFLFGLFFILVIYFYLVEIKLKMSKIEMSSEKNIIVVTVSISLILLIAGIYLFFIKNPPRIYDLSQFMSVFLIYIISKLNLVQKFFRQIYIICLLMALISPIRESLLFFDYLIDGKTYDKAVMVIRKYKGNNNILGTHAMWVLCDDLTKFSYWDGGQAKSPIFIQQSRQDIPNFVQNNGQILFDWRTDNVRRIFKIPITNRPQGYSFSVWKLQNKSLDSLFHRE